MHTKVLNLCSLLVMLALPAESLWAADISAGIFTITGPGMARLAPEILDVRPPSGRVTGPPGSMRIIDRSCRSTVLADVRRTIVNTAVQEWAWFGFLVDDLRVSEAEDGREGFNRRRFMSFDPVEVGRVADAVGGYWSAAPGSDWILQRQNDSWQGARGLSARWRDPWSAAFISWVMCESGLGEIAQFQRAIAHHTYIDQAIQARDGMNPEAAYVAYDPGEQPINPGDMICSGLRPVYRTLQQRRNQLGEGARTHCDIVVDVNEAENSILTIGGNVRSSVRLKIFPASAAAGGNLAPLPTNRIIFAHLQLKSAVIEPDALRNTPTLRNAGSLGCAPPVLPQMLAGSITGSTTAIC